MACKLQVTGIVQGVGFRPFAARLAAERGLSGFARNIGGAVEIFLQTDSKTAADFADALRLNAPSAADIKNIEITEAEDFDRREIAQTAVFDRSERSRSDSFNTTTNSFQILESLFREGEKFFPPDLGMCGECEEEILREEALRDAAGSRNRRSGYWFNSCVNCGPRYTIIERFPYDRANTTMKDFELCEACAADYANPSDRRFHAETVCCHECAEPGLRFYNGSEREAFYSADAALSGGKIIAVKGIGGYHLMCRADCEEAARQIRGIKGRYTKPFANMFYDLEELERVCEVSKKERELLTSAARPIVLLKPAPQVLGCAGVGLIAPQFSGRIGAFLPYTPLHKLLLKNSRRVIATSLNIDGAPIVIGDGEALSFFDEMKTDFPLFAGVLYNSRPIARRAEDSVAQVIGGKKPTASLLRRARGYVPLPVERNFGSSSMLALGGDLKAAFGIYTGNGSGNVIAGPYCGDLGNPESFGVYRETVDDLLNLFEVKPQIIIADAHPRYFTHGYAKELAGRFGAELTFVNHHHAHIASVMAEHELCGGKFNEKILGIAFDGTGYGTDGAVWGGEFLLCEGSSFRRFAHLEYVNLLGSDSSARDALKTAECYLHYHGINAGRDTAERLNPCSARGRDIAIGLRSAPHMQAGIIRAALDGKINTYKTSSMGRLFDAAAALLGLCAENTFEGECGTTLQYAAEEALRLGIPPVEMAFEVQYEVRHKNIIETLSNFKGDARSAALGFHIAVANAVCEMAELAREAECISSVALSGGVFQNALLTELISNKLAASGFKVFTNEKYPANDGGICLGQLYCSR